MQHYNLLPESAPIQQNLSLEMDMINGWMPKMKQKMPLQFDFSSPVIDSILNYNMNKTVYIAHQICDSYEMLQRYLKIEQNQYDSIKEVILKRQTITRQKSHRPYQGMNPYNYGAYFDSDFESGNLELVVYQGNQQYDLYMRVDSNTKGHCHWFNFKLKAIKEMQITLSICNLTRNSLYERGMRVFVLRNGQWNQEGDNVSFKQKNNRYYFSGKKYYQLKFDINVGTEQIQIATCVPYTYTQMLKFIEPLPTFILNQTVSGLNVPVIDFTNQNANRYILVTSRVHPGESNSSYVLEGFVNHLQNIECAYLRQNASIHIIPMLNPDGVVLGNYRTCITGKDLNRCYFDPDEQVFPTIFHLKKLLREQKNHFMYLDFHGHSIKKNCFNYGPEFPIYSNRYLKCRLFAKLMSKQTEVFRYFSGVWRVQRQKRTTSRAIINQEFDITHCFTVETSLGLYYMQSNQTTYEFSIQEWINLGRQIAIAVQELIKMEIQYDLYIQERTQKRKGRNSLFLQNNKMMQDLMNEIKQDEEQHKIQDVDELIPEGASQSESSQDDEKKFDNVIKQLQNNNSPTKIVCKQMKVIVPRSYSKPKQTRPSFLLNEIECRRNLILEPKSSNRKSENSQSFRPVSANQNRSSITYRTQTRVHLRLMARKQSFRLN